jgi:hypothetical protein
VEPTTLFTGFGEHLTHRAPESERAVADREHRRGHAATLGIAQQVGPGFGRFAVAVGQGDEFLAAIGPHADHHQQAQFVLLQADVDVDAVGPQVHVVHLGQIALGVGALLGLPGFGELGDHRRRQALRAAEELPERGHEIPRGQPVQVQHSPVSGSMRLSLTRGAVTSMAPALVSTSRG